MSTWLEEAAEDQGYDEDEAWVDDVIDRTRGPVEAAILDELDNKEAFVSMVDEAMRRGGWRIA